MRVLAHACALAVVVGIASGGMRSARAGAPVFDSSHSFVVVTFSNEPHRPSSHAGTTARRYAGDSYTVAQSAYDKARRIADSYSLKQVASWPIKPLAVHCVVYEIPDGRPVASVLAALTKEPSVTLAQPLQQFHTLTQGPHTYNDPLYDLQTNLVALGVSEAHERSQGAGVRVGLIDTGVDTKHPDLRDRISHTESFVPFRPDSARAYRHGTAMAGLIAAVANNHIGIVGIAPLARIEVFEACWQLAPDSDEAACNTFTLAQALAAAFEARIPLINLSIAGPADPLLAALVQTGLKRGVIFVGSASASADAFPTSIDGVISVGGSERDHGNTTLAAPANHIMTLRPEGQYDFESGTSVAAAEVTGMIALLLADERHLTADAAVSLLKATAGTGTAAAGDPGPINVGAALEKLETDRRSRRVAAGPSR